MTAGILDREQKTALNTTWEAAEHEGVCHGPPSETEPWCNADAHWKVTKRWSRSTFLPSPHFYALNQACTLLNKALGGFGCYLVGSSLQRRDYRDVDVRFILSDEEYARMFRSPDGGWTDPYWSLLCTAISAWLSKQTDLPIDFQIQQQTRANAEHHGHRNALGIFIDYPGERPSETPEDPKPTKDGGSP